MCLIRILLVFKICCLKIVLLKKVNMHFFFLSFNNSFKCKIAKMFVQVVTENG